MGVGAPGAFDEDGAVVTGGKRNDDAALLRACNVREGVEVVVDGVDGSVVIARAKGSVLTGEREFAAWRRGTHLWGEKPVLSIVCSPFAVRGALFFSLF